MTFLFSCVINFCLNICRFETIYVDLCCFFVLYSFDSCVANLFVIRATGDSELWF